MRVAYVSGITNDSFLQGVLVMFESLKSHIADKSAELVCIVPMRGG